MCAICVTMLQTNGQPRQYLTPTFCASKVYNASVVIRFRPPTLMSIARLKLVFLILTTVLLKTNAAIATTVAATTVATTPVTTIAPELQDADALFVLLNNRASLMRAVAVAKWRNGGAIEDLKREEQVVERVKSAA